jgi:predicted RNA-binding Zn-ribbon protein involved in translation (DUF1610 family)
MKYAIGQQVWWARFEPTETSVECPDCGGSGYIRCIMGDDTEVTVDCENCKVGYDQFSRGRITTYKRRPLAVQTTITGMDVRADKTEYRVPKSYIVEENRLFETEAEALAEAQKLADDATQEELNRIATKEKNTRSWSWNATYHRKQIRHAQDQIEYHTKKLNVASEKAKAERARRKADA